jgi:nucleoside-diphosphate-sugar epimerase
MTGCITMYGGTGFIGRHLVALLLQDGTTVRVAVRHPARVKVPAEPANPQRLSKPMSLMTSPSGCDRGRGLGHQPRRHSH